MPNHAGGMLLARTIVAACCIAHWCHLPAWARIRISTEMLDARISYDPREKAKNPLAAMD